MDLCIRTYRLVRWHRDQSGLHVTGARGLSVAGCPCGERRREKKTVKPSVQDPSTGAGQSAPSDGPAGATSACCQRPRHRTHRATTGPNSAETLPWRFLAGAAPSPRECAELRFCLGYRTATEVMKQAPAGVARRTRCRPVNRTVTGSTPSQGTCLGCGPGPQSVACKRQPHIDVSLPLFLPPFQPL